MARKLRDLVDLQRADVEALERRERQHHGWLWQKLQIWTERFEHLGKWAKALGATGAALATLWTVGSNAYKLVHKVAQIYEAKQIAPAEQPATNAGTASTTIDRVPIPITLPK